MQEARGSRRERLRKEREQRILDAAAAVFATKGYHGATIREIAVAADVADGTIYNYFDNKFDLLIGLFSRIGEVDHLPLELIEALEGDPRDFFVAAFRERMGHMAEGEEMLTAILPQVLVHPELRERFYAHYVQRIARLLEPYVQGQVDRGRIRPVSAPLVTRIVQGMFIGLLFLRILGDEPLRSNWDQMPELLATVIFDGLDAREGG